MFQFVVLAALVAVASAGVLDPIRGIGQSPIIGGTEATIQDAPWQVALQYQGEISCGGSIITPTAILTAAQCTLSSPNPDLWNVRAGSSTHAFGGTSYGVSKVVTHPLFTYVTFDYDIAVLILKEAIAIDDINTKIIPLPALNMDVPVNSEAFVTGWGSITNGSFKQRNLRKVTLPVVDQSVCTRAYYGFNPVTDRMLCGGLYGVGGVGACQGDAGGPFVVDGILVGVTSWGDGCALAWYPGVWTRVPALVDWIQEQL